MTTADLAILSLIVQSPRHGYEIEQVIEERGMRDWAEIGFSSIYYILKKLEAKGCVVSEMEDQETAGPPRRVYRATERGMAAWRAGTLEAISTPVRRTTPLLVGLANLPGLPPAEAIAALSRYCRGLEEREARIRTSRRAARADHQTPWHVEHLFDLSLTMTRAELSWVRKLMRRLSQRTAGESHAQTV